MSEKLYPLPEHQKRCDSFIEEIESYTRYNTPPYGVEIKTYDAQQMSHNLAKKINFDSLPYFDNSINELVNKILENFLLRDRAREIQSATFSEAVIYVYIDDSVLINQNALKLYLKTLSSKIASYIEKYKGETMTKDGVFPDYGEILEDYLVEDFMISILFFKEDLTD